MSDVRVAFLKGINVGGHRVTMEELRRVLAPIGLPDLATFIASGNLIFGTDPRASTEVEAGIETQLRETLGYDVDTFVRTVPELASVAEYTVAQIEGEGWKPHVMFGRRAASADDKAALKALETPDDAFRYHDREIVWMRRGGLTDSTIAAHHLNRALQKRPVTSRTLRTVQRLVAKLG